MVPYGDCPLDGERVGEMVYMDMLNRAQSMCISSRRIWILDGELKRPCALRQSAVDVHLILPRQAG